MSDTKTTETASKGPTTQAVLLAFRDQSKATQAAIAQSMKGGLSAVAHCSALAYQASMFGAARTQIAFLILGREKPKDSDGGEAKMYRAAMRLAGFWRLKGLPDSLKTANSFEAAVDAVLIWLASHDVRSVEGLQSFLSGESPTKDKKPIAERFATSIKSALKDNAFSVVDAMQVGAGLVGAMGLENAAAFVKSAQDTLAALAAAKVEAATTEAQAKAA